MTDQLKIKMRTLANNFQVCGVRYEKLSPKLVHQRNSRATSGVRGSMSGVRGSMQTTKQFHRGASPGHLDTNTQKKESKQEPKGGKVGNK